MKKFKKIILPSAVALICSLSVKAQKSDYVINNHDDTIKCQVKTPIMGKPRYKPANANSDGFIKITVDSIKEYYTSKNSTAYRRIHVDSTGFGPRVQYLEVVERGSISLYLQITNSSNYNSFTHTSYSSSSDQWYVTKNSDTATLLKTSGLSIFMKSRSKRKNELAEMLKDKPTVYDKFIKENKFSFDDVQNIVHLYNTGLELPKKPEEEAN